MTSHQPPLQQQQYRPPTSTLFQYPTITATQDEDDRASAPGLRQYLRVRETHSLRSVPRRGAGGQLRGNSTTSNLSSKRKSIESLTISKRTNLRGGSRIAMVPSVVITSSPDRAAPRSPSTSPTRSLAWVYGLFGSLHMTSGGTGQERPTSLGFRYASADDIDMDDDESDVEMSWKDEVLSEMSQIEDAEFTSQPPPIAPSVEDLVLRADRHLAFPSYSPLANNASGRSVSFTNMRRIKDIVARTMPQAVQESEFSLETYDKVFSAAWLNSKDVVVGTKCNKLLVIGTESGRKIQIPQVLDHSQQVSARTTPRTSVSTTPPRPVARAQAQPHSPSFWTWLRPPPLNILPPSIAATPNAHIPTQYSRTLTAPQQQQPSTSTSTSPQTPINCCGIHSISINPSKTLLATGSGKPTDTIQIFSQPEFCPKILLSGHTDVVFAVDWLNDGVLASGSRDGTIRIWNVHEALADSADYNTNIPITCTSSSSIILQSNETPLSSSSLHPSSAYTITPHHHLLPLGKIRDLKYNQHTKTLAALSSRGFLKLYDASRASSSPSSYSSSRRQTTTTTTNSLLSIPLIHTSEIVCLAIDTPNDIYAVGSEDHISIVDPRTAAVVHVVRSLDDSHGVRSVCIEQGVVTVGGGKGRVSFYDLRARKYVSWKARYGGDDGESGSGSKRMYLTAGPGWLSRDPVYLTHFNGMAVNNAIYTLSYDETGTRLFAAGGPLQLNLRGSYAGLWR